MYNPCIMVYILCFVAGSVGYFLNAICGFGAGIFSMMFLPYAMGSTMAAAALVNISTVFQAGWAMIYYRRKIGWKQMLIPLAAYFIVSTLTVHFTKNVSNDGMKIALGTLLIALSVYFLFIARQLRMKANVRNSLLAGGIGGVMSAMFSVGGPPISLYYSSVFDDKEAYLATIQSYFFVSNIYIIALRAYNGIITKDVLICSAVAVVGMALGTWFGKKVFDRISADTVRKIIYIMMAFSGVIMLIETLL